MKPLHVLIVDDHKMVRDGLSLFLKDVTSLQVVSAVGSLSDMFSILKQTRIDVILLDFRLNDGDGINGAIKARDLQPQTKIILLTAHLDAPMLQMAIKAKIEAVLFKDVLEETLIDVVHQVHQGRYDIWSNIPRKFRQSKPDRIPIEFHLTERERDILSLLSMGRTNAEIANHLKIAEKTVRNALHLLYQKIHVSNRTEATIFWLTHQT